MLKRLKYEAQGCLECSSINVLEHLEHKMLGGAGLARVPSLPVTALD
jgi:hypothetical protein